MREQIVDVAGLRTTIVTNESAVHADVVLLHGYSMEPAALAPFAHSLRLPVRFLLPQAQHAAEAGGYSWWHVDAERRQATLERGPRDLAETFPEGRSEARSCLRQFLHEARLHAPQRSLVLCGFSQGGMLACDSVLVDDLQVSALALLSSSRIAASEWLRHRTKLRELPVLVSHGTQDDDLAFAAGEALRDFLIGSGARVTWLPFEGGHAIPLAVWRQVKRIVEPFT